MSCLAIWPLALALSGWSYTSCSIKIGCAEISTIGVVLSTVVDCKAALQCLQCLNSHPQQLGKVLRIRFSPFHVSKPVIIWIGVLKFLHPAVGHINEHLIGQSASHRYGKQWAGEHAGLLDQVGVARQHELRVATPVSGDGGEPHCHGLVERQAPAGTGEAAVRPHVKLELQQLELANCGSLTYHPSPCVGNTNASDAL